ncbi:forkhead box protein O4 [Clarias gariepinus]
METDKAPPIDPDFEPQSRPRSCTWPLPRPDISAVKVEGPDGAESAAGTPPAEEDKQEPQPIASEPEKAAASEGGVIPGVGGATPRKGSSRRNAWGNQSYADLISQAIENSPEKRLTLAQIYDWMVKTVPYFKDKGDSNSSAGWKNSIRHNLSLHNKFLRVHNESTGKSSWWMLNPEGGKTGKSPRRRAASMDNSTKLLKSRMRAKQTKKQAAAGGVGGPGSTMQGEGVPGAGSADSPGPPGQFGKWGVSSNSPSSRSLDDQDMWTSFRPRTSSNASTLSGRHSPIPPVKEDEDDLPEDGLLSGYPTSSLPPTLAETLMEELDLIDGLTLMTAQQGSASPSTAPQAPPTPLPSASTLLPRGTNFTSFCQLQPVKGSQGPSQQGSPSSVQQPGESNTSISNFGNSLFNPLPGPGSRGGFSTHVPSSLEALLTSDSPPPSDILMTQVDPLMPSQGGVNLLGLGDSISGNQAKSGQMTLGKNMDTSPVPQMTLQPQSQLQPQQHSQMNFGMMMPSMGQDLSQLPPMKTQNQMPGGGLLQHGAVPSAAGSGGLQGINQYGTQPCFLPSHDRLPTDLDIEMFTENLDCDVDYIINSDLMDGESIDFNFDPIAPGGQNYPGPATTQSSSHNWVPS